MDPPWSVRVQDRGPAVAGRHRAGRGLGGTRRRRGRPPRGRATSPSPVVPTRSRSPTTRPHRRRRSSIPVSTAPRPTARTCPRPWTSACARGATIRTASTVMLVGTYQLAERGQRAVARAAAAAGRPPRRHVGLARSSALLGRARSSRRSPARRRSSTGCSTCC